LPFNFILAAVQYGVTYLPSSFYYFSLIATLCKYELYLAGAFICFTLVILAMYGLYLLRKKSAFISNLCKRKKVEAIQDIVEDNNKVNNPNSRD